MVFYCNNRELMNNRGDGKKTVLKRERLIGGTLENLPYRVKERLG